MKFLILFTIFTFALNSQAAKKSTSEVRTDSLFDNKSDEVDATFDVFVIAGTVQQLPSSQKIEFSGYVSALGLGYGLSDFATVYIQQEYASMKRTYTNPSSVTDLKGAGNTRIGVKGLSTDFVLLYYNVMYTAGVLNKSKYDYDAGTTAPVVDRPHTDIELALGLSGSSLTVGFLGALKIYSKNAVQVRASGQNIDTTYDSGSGTDLKAFLQYNPSFTIGAFYEADETSGFIIRSGGTSSNADPQKTIETGVYGIIPISSAEVLLKYSGISYEKPSNVTSTLTGAQIGLRLPL